MKNKNLNRRQARWALYLSRFEFKIIHKSGTSMGKADSLSWRPDHKEGVEDDNKNQVLLKPKFFKIAALRRGRTLIEGAEKSIPKKIQASQELDEDVSKAVEALKSSGMSNFYGGEWEIEQG